MSFRKSTTEQNADLFSERIARYRRFQDAVYHRKPGFVLCEIEPTTSCTAGCVFCPRHELTRERGAMTCTQAELIAEHLACSPPQTILFSGIGEPALHPALPELVSIFRKKPSALTGIVTNAAHLTPQLSEALLEAGTDFFHVSIHAHTARTADAVSPGIQFERVEEHMEKLLARTGNRAIVAVNFVSTPQNSHEKRDVIRTWKEKGVFTVYCSREHNRGGFNPLRQTPTSGRTSCWLYSNTLFVSWDGSVLSCCHDFQGSIRYGNLAAEPLFQIWREKAEMKQQTLARSMCRACNFTGPAPS